MEDKYYKEYKTAVGLIYIAVDSEGITHITTNKNSIDITYEQKEVELIHQTYRELKEYFAGRHKTFDLPLNPKGTEFQQKVWCALREIPYGETRCYEQIAQAVGNPKGCRAVGMANNRNPIMIVIPCHRVVGKNGNLTGYAGGLALKEKLLQLEKRL